MLFLLIIWLELDRGLESHPICLSDDLLHWDRFIVGSIDIDIDIVIESIDIPIMDMPMNIQDLLPSRDDLRLMREEDAGILRIEEWDGAHIVEPEILEDIRSLAVMVPEDDDLMALHPRHDIDDPPKMVSCEA